MELPDSSVYAGTLELTVVSLLADKPPTFSRSRIILADVLALLWRVGVKVEVSPYGDGVSDKGVTIWLSRDDENEVHIMHEETASGSQAAALICLAAWKLAHRQPDSAKPPIRLPELLEQLQKKLS